MAIKQLKEVNRHPGLAVDPTFLLSGNIIGGQPVVLASASTLKPYAGTGVPFGLAIESTEQLSAGTGNNAGSGYDYTGYARGGKVSAFMDGGIFEITNDGRGYAYVSGDTYTLNAKVYVNNSGLITSDAGNSTAGYNPEVGIVMAVEGAAPVTKLTIKATI